MHFLQYGTKNHLQNEVFLTRQFPRKPFTNYSRMRAAAANRLRPAKPSNMFSKAVACITAIGREATYAQYTPKSSKWLKVPPVGTISGLLSLGLVARIRQQQCRRSTTLYVFGSSSCLVGGCPGAVVNLTCRQEQLDWGCQWRLIRTLERPAQMGLKDVTAPRHSSHDLLARLMERIRPRSSGILHRFLHPYRLGSVRNFDLDEHQHNSTHPEFLVRIFRCPTYHHVLWVHHRCYDASSEYSPVL